MGEFTNPHGRQRGGRQWQPNYRGDDEYKLQVDIPNFSGDLGIERFFDWLTKVDRFFEYTEYRKVKFVTYKLKRRALVWWDRLREMRMREGLGPIQTWCRMKQLLQGICLPSDYEQYIFYAYQKFTQSSRSVNEYTAKCFRLVERNT